MLIYLTYCSAQKNFSKKEISAIELYDSKRITNIARRAKKDTIHFCILSGKYGLLDLDQKIAYYNHLLKPSEVESHSRCIATQITSKKITKIVFFTKPVETDPNLLPYIACIESACEKANIQLKILVTP